MNKDQPTVEPMRPETTTNPPRPYWKAKAEADHATIQAQAQATWDEGAPPREACPYQYGTAACDLWWGYYDLAKRGRSSP